MFCKKAVLVVEDDELQRELISEILKDDNYEVFECESGEAAELLLERNGEAISLLVTDVGLAGKMTGAELAQRARVRRPTLGILVSSGTCPAQGIPQGAKFLQKPWSPSTLVREARALEAQTIRVALETAPNGS